MSLPGVRLQTKPDTLIAKGYVQIVSDVSVDVSDVSEVLVIRVIEVYRGDKARIQFFSSV